MAADVFVLQSVVKQVQYFVNTVTLNIEQIFDCVDIVLVPFQLEPFATSHVQLNFAFLLRFKHVAIEQIIDLFVVELQEGDVDS